MAEEIELLTLLEAEDAYQRTHRLHTLFPATGRFARTHYPKHLAFFAAGTTHRERLFIAANRVGKCLTYQTVIETVGGERTLGELWEAGRQFCVWAWDGQQRVMAEALAPFQKSGLHQCYRVIMQDGRWFECADDHRILTVGGWRLFSQLLACGAIPLASSAELCPSTPAVNGPHWSETPQDFRGDCLQDRHCDGGPLPWAGDTAGAWLPLPDGVLQHSGLWWQRDGGGHSDTSSVLSSYSPLSSQDDAPHVLDQCAVSGCQTDNTSVARWYDQSEAAAPRRFASGAPVQSTSVLVQGTGDTSPRPWLLPFSIDANSILSCIPIGFHRVYDFTVPRYHNYLTAGLVHHNTRAACYELGLHLTGQYPDWWPGKRFARPIRAWAAGTTSKKVKEILQEELFGPVGQWGTGVLPQDTFVRPPTKAAGSVPDLIDSALIRHTSGGASLLTLKYYEQGRDAFEGTKQEVILEDEEPPLTIHSENVIRTMDTTGTGEDNGLVLTTFTPLEGLSDTVLYFLPEGALPAQPEVAGRWVGNATWDDVPHLDAATKATLLAAIPAYQRDARTRGIPVLGAGVIYPVEESAYLVEPFTLPKHYLRAYGMDVGWNRTAAVWGAYDREHDTWYLTHEHYRGEAEPSVHAAACKAPGAWIRGVIDPAARGRSQADGVVLLETYRDLGLQLSVAVNAVEAGIYEVLERLTQGRLKVFTSLSNWRKEARLYRRDPKGRIIKQDDHALDATRYLILSGLEVARAVPVPRDPDPPLQVTAGQGAGWRSTFVG